MDAAFLLDPANALIVTEKYIPPWGSLNQAGKEACKTILKRITEPGRQEAVIQELQFFISNGYADLDFARNAQVIR